MKTDKRSILLSMASGNPSQDSPSIHTTHTGAFHKIYRVLSESTKSSRKCGSTEHLIGVLVQESLQGIQTCPDPKQPGSHSNQWPGCVVYPELSSNHVLGDGLRFATAASTNTADLEISHVSKQSTTAVFQRCGFTLWCLPIEDRSFEGLFLLCHSPQRKIIMCIQVVSSIFLVASSSLGKYVKDNYSSSYSRDA